MKKPSRRPAGRISLPLSPRGKLVIFDRDATIISSREIAYACYRAAFSGVVRPVASAAAELSEKKFSRAYHPFDRTGVYEVYYPWLRESDRTRIGEISWEFYLGHYRDPEFNLLIPGMDGLIRALKAAGAIIVILTASDGDGAWMKRYRIPVDGFFSVVRLQQARIIQGKKPEAIRHILDRYGKMSGEAVTIGDNPKDHVEEVVSIGTPFGLGSPAARRDLKKAVDLYGRRVENLYEFFNLTPSPGGGRREEDNETVYVAPR